MHAKSHRVTGPCYYLDDEKSLVTVPLGTIVEISELPGAMLMRWTDSAAERREQYYTPQIWLRHVSKQIEPLEELARATDARRGPRCEAGNIDHHDQPSDCR